MPSCPVCHRENISQNEKNCPQCNADLTSFAMLDNLASRENQPGKANNKGLYVFSVLTLAVLLIMVWYIFLRLDLQQKAAQVNQPGHQKTSNYLMDNKAIVAKLERLSSQLAQLDNKQQTNLVTLTTLIKAKPGQAEIPAKTPAVRTPLLAVLPSKSQNNRQYSHQSKPQLKIGNTFFVYQATKNETLWSIAKRFYKHGFYYPVLLADNPQLSVYQHNNKRSIRISTEPKHWQTIYHNRVLVTKGNMFYKYKVLPEDSWDSIALNFYGNKENQALKAINKNIKLHAGATILIPLK